MKTITSPRIALSMLLPVTLLFAGCAVNVTGHTPLGKEEYKTVFSQVLRKSFDEKATNNICLPSLFGFGPSATPSTEVAIDNDLKNPQAPKGCLAQFRVLESLGLLASSESERTVNNKVLKFATFTRTAKGESYYANGTLCCARAELDEIVKWKGPLVLGKYQVAWVYYTTKTLRIEDWAKSPEVLATFPTVTPIVAEKTPKVRQVAIDLSSIGWDIAEYSKMLQME